MAYPTYSSQYSQQGGDPTQLLGAASPFLAAASGPAAPIVGAALPAALQLYSFFRQSRQRRNLKPQDITPAYQREALALARQRAGAQMPGYGAAANRLAQQSANSGAAAARAATSSGALLGTLNAIDQNQKGAETQLAAQQQQYAMAQQGALQGELGRSAQWQERGRQEFAGARSALDQSRFANLNGAISTASTGAMYALAARRYPVQPTMTAAAAPTTSPAPSAYGQFMPQNPGAFSAPRQPSYYDLLQRQRGYPMADFQP